MKIIRVSINLASLLFTSEAHRETPVLKKMERHEAFIIVADRASAKIEGGHFPEEARYLEQQSGVDRVMGVATVMQCVCDAARESRITSNVS